MKKLAAIGLAFAILALYVSLAVPQGIPFPGPGGGPSTSATVTLTDSPVDTTNTNVFTFVGAAIGTAATGRRVIVACAGAVSPTTITSLTVGGNAATAVVSQAGGSGNSVAAMFIIQVDTGTTATIVVTFGVASTVGAGCAIWAAYDLLSSTPTQTGVSTATPLATTLNISGGGVAVAYAESFSGATPTYTWSGLTESVDEPINNGAAFSHSAANDNFGSAQVALAISATMSATSAGQRALVAASFR